MQETDLIIYHKAKNKSHNSSDPDKKKQIWIRPENLNT